MLLQRALLSFNTQDAPCTAARTRVLPVRSGWAMSVAAAELQVQGNTAAETARAVIAHNNIRGCFRLYLRISVSHQLGKG